MNDVLEWPERLLRHVRLRAHLQYATRSAGAALDGGEQIVASLASRWRLDFDIAAAPGPIAREWRGWVTAMEGRLNWALIPLDDHLLYDLRDAQEPYSDGEFFTDDTGFIARDSLIFAAAASAGATKIRISGPPGHKLRIGDYFSLDHNLHQVIAPGPEGDLYPIRPPLPAAVAAGVEIEATPPRVLARLAEDDSGALDLVYGRWGDPTKISFISEIR